MDAIRALVHTAGPAIGFTEADISARYLYAGVVISLLMARVDPNTIRLLGRWWSDVMIRYLHTMANSFSKDLAIKMFQHGTYTLIPPAHDGNYFQAALTGPQGPYSKGFLEPGKIIKQQINRRYAGH